MYSFRIEQAVQAACVLHEDQHRIGKQKLPYVTHLFSVFLIAQEYTDDEDTLVAALLHDTLEDTAYTFEDLQSDFGQRVSLIVSTVTEPRIDGAKVLDRSTQKKIYATQIKKGPNEAVLVACADKVHNMRATLLQYYDTPANFLRDFPSSLESRLIHFGTLSNIFNARLRDGLLEEFNQVYSEYKNFISSAKKYEK